MPRQRGGAAPRRPTAAPARPAAPATPPARHSSTAAAPPASAPTHAPQAQAAPQQSSGPGMLGQIASTAAGVAVGSTVGHGLSNLFFGGSSSSSEPAAQQQSNEFAQQHSQVNSSSATGACAGDVQNFRKCMDENQGSLTICGWYLDQLKACQQAAGQY